jgi:hypothetical protein
MLDDLANRLEGKARTGKGNFEDSFQLLQQTIRAFCWDGRQELLTVELQSFVTLSRSLKSVATYLNDET